SKLPKTRDGSDGSWAVNNRITKSVMSLTGMEIVQGDFSATNKLMKTYSSLRHSDSAAGSDRTDMGDPFIRAVETLRGGLSVLESTPDLAAIQRGRDEVYARFGPLFSPTHLPTLTADEFVPFLDFKVNRHWSYIHRYKGRLTSDIDI